LISGAFLFPCATASALGAVSTQLPSLAGELWFRALLVFVTTLLVALLARWQLLAHRRSEERLEQEVKVRTEEINQTAEILRRINEGIDVEETLDLVYDSFQAIVPYNRIGYAELLDEGARVGAVWARTDAEESLLPVGYELPMEKTSLGQVLERRKPRILNDLEAYLRQRPESESTRLMVDEGMRSSLTVPLYGLGRTQGLLFFSSRRANAYTPDHVRIIQRLASQLAVIIGKSRLHEELIVATWNLEEANRRLESLARVDPLTGLGNRRFFEDRLESEWRRQLREEQPLGLILVDVDHFKEFNDTYGHQAGDRCLQKIAGVLQSVARRAGDEVARWGGEELVVLLPKVGFEGTRRVAEDLRIQVAGLEIEHTSSPVLPFVTISAGFTAVVPSPAHTPDQLVRAADSALYRAKETGRNRIEGQSLEAPCSPVDSH